MKSALHLAALDYAKRGMPPLACGVSEKTPATAHGVNDATCDPAAIDALWTRDEYNIGIALERAGLCAIDLDGPDAEDAWFTLQVEHGFACDTYEVKTPRGRHLYFKGSLPPTISKLGSHIDTRGRGSYVLAPPSVVDGKLYVASNDLVPAELPAWVAGLLEKPDRKSVEAPAATGKPVDAPLVENILRRISPACDRNQWLTVCGGLVNAPGPKGDWESIFMRWSRGEFHDGIVPANYQGPEDCVAQWARDVEKRTNGEDVPAFGALVNLARECGYVGPSHSEDLKETFAGYLASPEAQDDQASMADASAYGRPKTAGELATETFALPYYAWEGFFLAEHVNLDAGDGGSGKTFLLQQSGVAIAAGLPLFGRATRQMPVLLVLAEDDHGATQQRLKKICEVMQVDMADLPLYLWCLPGRDVNIASIAEDGTWSPGPFMEPLRAQLANIGRPALVGIDTVADIAALDETKRLAVNTFCKQVLGGFCRDFGATVVVNAHPSKAAMADGSGYAGSTAWNNAVRSRLTLERPDAKSNRRILKVAKANYGDNAELELFLVDGVFWRRDQGDAAASNERLMAACVAAAIVAAEHGTPIQAQRRPAKWVFDEIEKDGGRRPSRRELLEMLDYASRAGKVRYLKGNNKRMAGFYPWDERRAAELALEAKRHSVEVEALTSSPKKAGGQP